MELINGLEVNEDSIVFESTLRTGNNIISNTHIMEARTYRFSNPAQGTERDRFIMRYSGNIQNNDQDQTAVYILIKQDENVNYLINSDRLDTVLKFAQ